MSEVRQKIVIELEQVGDRVTCLVDVNPPKKYGDELKTKVERCARAMLDKAAFDFDVIGKVKEG